MIGRGGGESRMQIEVKMVNKNDILIMMVRQIFGRCGSV